MKLFDTLLKSIKKTIRYIHQDVKSVEKLEEIERQLVLNLQKRKEVLKAEQ